MDFPATGDTFGQRRQIQASSMQYQHFPPYLTQSRRHFLRRHLCPPALSTSIFPSLSLSLTHLPFPRLRRRRRRQWQWHYARDGDVENSQRGFLEFRPINLPSRESNTLARFSTPRPRWSSSAAAAAAATVAIAREAKRALPVCGWVGSSRFIALRRPSPLTSSSGRPHLFARQAGEREVPLKKAEIEGDKVAAQ